MLTDKEDNALSPAKDVDSPLLRKGLRPLSPNKTNVGRLSFIQSGNMDEHFERIHYSHADITQLLGVLEVQTKQTNVDLEQLFDRLKSNNSNLNKVLERIAQYSLEVITEGNATKSDIERMNKELEKLRTAVEKNCLAFTDSSTEIKNQLQATQTSTIQEMIGPLKELCNNVENSGSDSRTLLNLEPLTEKLENQERLLNELTLKVTGHSRDLEEQIEAKRRLLKDLDDEYRERRSSNLELIKKHEILEAKYAQLTSAYNSKYAALGELQSKFTSLSAESSSILKKVGAPKYGNLSKLHNSRIDALEPPSPSERKRISSLPHPRFSGGPQS